VSFHPDDVALARAIGCINYPPPDYLTSRADCYIAELSIERMGLADAYAAALVEAMSDKVGWYDVPVRYTGPHTRMVPVEGSLFALVTAPSDVRVRAMLQVLGKEASS
jgi:hypothetical protein